MKNHIKVIIKDDLGLGDALLKEGRSQAWVDETKKIIQRQFEKAAKRVFSHVLGKFTPCMIWVQFNPYTFGKERKVLASYSVGDGREIHFTVYRSLVASVMDKGNHDRFKRTVIHEMIHAVDNKIMKESYGAIYDNWYGRRQQGDDDNALAALREMLLAFRHFRVEGLAELGACMLTKSPARDTANTQKRFRMLYDATLLKSWKRAQGEPGAEDIFDDDVSYQAYLLGPTMMVLVLEKRGDVTKEVAKKTLEGLETGNYKLSDAEMKAILEAALSLTLPDYIQAVVSLGPEVAPISLFLSFCALLQKDFDNDYIYAFKDLVGLSKSPIIFDVVMEKILGQVMAEDEIDNRYLAFSRLPDIEASHPQIKDKVARLYDVLKNNEKAEAQRIARWALTYLFKKRDILHDDIKVIGYMDDMIVLDYALKILKK